MLLQKTTNQKNKPQSALMQNSFSVTTPHDDHQSQIALLAISASSVPPYNAKTTKSAFIATNHLPQTCNDCNSKCLDKFHKLNLPYLMKNLLEFLLQTKQVTPNGVLTGPQFVTCFGNGHDLFEKILIKPAYSNCWIFACSSYHKNMRQQMPFWSQMKNFVFAVGTFMVKLEVLNQEKLSHLCNLCTFFSNQKNISFDHDTNGIFCCPKQGPHGCISTIVYVEFMMQPLQSHSSSSTFVFEVCPITTFH